MQVTVINEINILSQKVFIQNKFYSRRIKITIATMCFIFIIHKYNIFIFQKSSTNHT